MLFRSVSQSRYGVLINPNSNARSSFFIENSGDGDNIIRRVKFAIPRKIPGDYSVSYYTTKENCPVCKASGKVRSLVMKAGGNYDMLSGVPKLNQQLMPFLLTPVGKHPFYPWIGTRFSDFVGSKDDVEGMPVLSEVENGVDSFVEVYRKYKALVKESVEAEISLQDFSVERISPVFSKVYIELSTGTIDFGVKA